MSAAHPASNQHAVLVHQLRGVPQNNGSVLVAYLGENPRWSRRCRRGPHRESAKRRNTCQIEREAAHSTGSSGVGVRCILSRQPSHSASREPAASPLVLTPGICDRGDHPAQTPSSAASADPRRRAVRGRRPRKGPRLPKPSGAVRRRPQVPGRKRCLNYSSARAQPGSSRGSG